MASPDQEQGVDDRIERIERRATSAIAEMQEGMAKTDATGSRSTSRQKTRAQRAADRARSDAYCEAVCILTGELTPLAVEMRLRERVAQLGGESRRGGR